MRCFLIFFVVLSARDAEIAVINAEREANVTVINTRKKISEKRGELEMAQIQNEMLLSKQKAEADAAYYTMMKEAESWSAKLTEPYLRYVLFTSLANSTKIYFGEKIPTIFSEMLVGASALTAQHAATAAATGKSK